MSGALAVAPGQSPTPSKFPREFGGYRLLGVLGTGGMGTVYEAEQLATGRRVALKMLEQQLDSSELRQRFLREGRLAASVNHPNSLYVFGSEEIESAPVITMEIAGSGTLNDKLKKRGPFPVRSAVDAILDVISGLEAAFASGVLHRDVKPSNCFVSPDGSVKVGDFGLSVSTLATGDSWATATGVILGTPAFAPPEQLRGDELDVRADIYSVGATLFTLLTGRAPFEGKNAVQVVANAVNQKPKPVSELREDVPPGLERVVARCLAKEPEGRYDNYMALRNALLPFSSREPEPASMKVRASAGWIDYLIAFLVPYVILMLAIGNEQFHFRLLMERTVYSASHYIAFLGFGFLYFSIVEGIWGAGLGKRLKGLRVVRTNGRPPGIGRALIRILVPILCIEVVRVPLLLASITATHINDLTTFEIVLFSVATSLCPLIPILLVLRARRENGFATAWDLASGTRVVMKPAGTVRPSIEPAAQPQIPVEGAESLGPYRLTKELVPGKWIVATDPVLRRQVWLLRRAASELPVARRSLARSGRLRWLQKVDTAEATWDAFEATQGTPFSSLVAGGKRLPWGTLRHWLHDLASELWDASGDRTLPAELSLDHVWVSAQGHAVLLDEPWPGVDNPAERIPVGDVAGQQRFLNAIAACVESTSLPLHARPVLQNLEVQKFEKLSFLAGTLRGLLSRPAEVSKGTRAGSIFMLPFYVWIMVFVGAYQGAEWLYEIVGDSAVRIAMAAAMLVLSASAVVQLLELPLRTTAGHATFRLAVVNAQGERAGVSQLLLRWTIVWLPLFVPMGFVALLSKTAAGIAFISAVVLLLLWISAAVHAAMHTERGLHDRLAGTWVVRR
ncbi:MAG: protein kinase domain-containing protein [Planctomycetota bacterium]